MGIWNRRESTVLLQSHVCVKMSQPQDTCITRVICLVLCCFHRACCDNQSSQTEVSHWLLWPKS